MGQVTCYLNSRIQKNSNIDEYIDDPKEIIKDDKSTNLPVSFQYHSLTRMRILYDPIKSKHAVKSTKYMSWSDMTTYQNMNIGFQM